MRYAEGDHIADPQGVLLGSSRWACWSLEPHHTVIRGEWLRLRMPTGSEPAEWLRKS